VGELRNAERLRPPRCRRPELRDHTVAVHHQHDLAGGGEPDVFAQAVLEELDSDSAHSRKVATGSYLIKPTVVLSGIGHAGNIGAGSRGALPNGRGTQQNAANFFASLLRPPGVLPSEHAHPP
jgi:hypothetical protein